MTPTDSFQIYLKITLILMLIFEPLDEFPKQIIEVLQVGNIPIIQLVIEQH